MTPTLEALHKSFMSLLNLDPASQSMEAVPGPIAAPTVPAAPALVSTSDGGMPPVAPGAVAVAVPALPVGPCQWVDAKKRGWHLDVRVPPGEVVEAARLVDAQGFAMDAVTGVDWIAAGEMEVVYDFFHPISPLRIVVRTRVPRDKAELPTISGVFPGANWHERETHDFFGIVFTGHPDLSPLLLPEDADFHPLRKDFVGAP